MTDWDKADIRQVVDLPEWQRLRGKLVGTWMQTPELNVRLLKMFLGSKPDRRRLRIVHNYLTGTAFRIGKISHPAIDQLLEDVRQRRTK